MPAIASAPTDPRPPSTRGSTPALTLAAVAALLASTCCVLPLVFVLVGISGAWISQLHRLEPYSLWLAALAVASLGLAAWRLYRPSASADGACAVPDAACRAVNAAARRWFWAVALLTLVPLVVPLAAPLFY
jgi:mercuric ion transport protein